MDTIVGSAGDDTITATAVNATTGAAQTTINSGDSIDGGAGTGDSLTLTITGTNNNSLTGLTIKNVENISYVGSDNLGTGSAALAAATLDAAAKADAVTALVAARASAAANKDAAATALAASIVANGTVNASSGLAISLTKLKADIAALTTTGAQLETDIAALTLGAGIYMSAAEKTTVDAATGIAATNLLVDTLIAAAGVGTGKAAALTKLKADIAALTNAGTLEADIAALTATAATALLTAGQKTDIDAAVGITATNALITPLITAAVAKNSAVVAATAADASATSVVTTYAPGGTLDAATYLADAVAKATLAGLTASTAGTASIAAPAEATSITYSLC